MIPDTKSISVKSHFDENGNRCWFESEIFEGAFQNKE